LDSATIENIKWQELPESSDVWRVEGEGKNEYRKGFSVSELFIKNTTGIVTMGDGFIIDKDKNALKNRVNEFLNNNISESELKNKYDLGKNYAKWVIENKNKIDRDNLNVTEISYRPFDTRYTCFDSNLVWRTRKDTMNNFVNKDNLGLVLTRQCSLDWKNIFITNKITESSFVSNKTSEIGSTFPLYIYTDYGEKIPNLNKEIFDKIKEISNNKEDKNIGKGVSPEDIFDYIYGYLHDKNYRQKYNEFLKTDFPRVPYPKNKEEFSKYVKMGNSLRNLHLMNSKALEGIKLEVNFPHSGTNTVEDKYPKYIDQKVYINEKQHFENVSQNVWEFYIGGYQPAQKWLKDRKGSVLSYEDILHYQNIVKVLSETGEIMKKLK
jgi:predicted helicase